LKATFCGSRKKVNAAGAQILEDGVRDVVSPMFDGLSLPDNVSILTRLGVKLTPGKEKKEKI
jgi:hypothetical protein